MQHSRGIHVSALSALKWNERYVAVHVGNSLQMNSSLKCCQCFIGARRYTAQTRRPICALSPNKSTAGQNPPHTHTQGATWSRYLCHCCMFCRGTASSFPQTVGCFSMSLKHSSHFCQVQETKDKQSLSMTEHLSYSYVNRFKLQSVVFCFVFL